MRELIILDDRLRKKIEKHRKDWSEIAREYHWYKKPFYVQVWIKDGQVRDSVSTTNLQSDILIIEYSEDEDDER